MDKRISTVLGAGLVVVGILALASTLGLPILGIGFRLWRLWPLFVLGAGLCFVLPPLMRQEKRGLSFLFIPGMPVLTTGALLFWASLFDQWGIWARFWPLEVLAVAAGFLFAAVFTGKIGVAVPAVIIGVNGLVLQFCAITGLWGLWAVLWTIEPLSVGLALLLLYMRTRSPGLLKAGFILCGIAGVAAMGMASLLNWPLVGSLGPAVLILVGVWLLRRGGFRWPLTTSSTTPE